MKSILAKKKSLFAVAIILLSFALMLYWGNKKEGYHVDELYSYGLANSEYLPFMHFGESGYDVKDWMLEYGAGENPIDLVKNLMKDFRILKDAGFSVKNTEIYSAYLLAQANSSDTYTTTWVNGGDYVDYLSSSKTNRFNYSSVYYNQRGDVHPPFFYLLLHTICSFFPGIFSKWFGMSLNIVVILLVQCMLYHLGKKHFGGELTGLVFCAAYGLSVAAVSTGIFIRMYALLTLMVVSDFCVHLSILKDGTMKKHKKYLFLVTLLGFLTQYYFVLYAIILAVVTGILFLIKKKWKLLLQYCLLLGVTACVGLAIWPFAIRHVFSGYRGQASLNALAGGSFSVYRLRIVFNQIVQLTLGGAWWLLPVFLLLFLISFTVYKIITPNGSPVVLDAETTVAETEKYPDLRAPEMAAVMVIPVAVYLMTVSQIIPFLTERYFMCLFPFVLMAVVWLGYGAGRLWDKTAKQKNSKIKPSAVTVVLTGLVLFLLNNAILHQPVNLFTGGQETVEIAENTDCIYVLPNFDWNESAEDTNILAQCRQVAIVYESNLEILSDYEFTPGTTLLVCIQNGLDEEEVLNKVREALNVEFLTETKRQDSGTFRRIFLNE